MSIQAFQTQGNTVAFSVTATIHASVKVSSVPTGSSSYMIFNAGPDTVFVDMASTSAAAVAVIPTDGTPASGMPIPSGGLVYWVGPPDAYFSMICASTKTATVYVTPGDGK